ncbi:DUF998 domain-containing protein [candidate division WS5 bacterium]|uniref:DUF998 domain-containing protein n=1 Tax=candidate division WS5 bacterium TaxID=2093353 RepID=A0A419DFR7_9BACT|nr:MAG: DUF998 domain-containing protein [candidate division WS5 bacterium]
MKVARISIATTLTFLLLLAILHVIKPEIEPSWRMISEYEIGNFGWLMQVAFFSWALGSISLSIALWPHLRTIAGRIGAVLLLVASLGMAIGGLFVTDPITTATDAFSTAGILHSVGGVLMIFSAPFIVALISWSLLRHNPFWVRARHWLLWPAALVWLSLVAYFVILFSAGAVGPDVPIGWPNRIFVLAYSIWVLAAAWQVGRIEKR